jgi:DNA-binding MarR family transcriptional regulator
MTKELILNDLLRAIRKNYQLLKKGSDFVHKNTTLTPAIRGIIEILNDQGAITVPHLAKLRYVSRQSIQTIMDQMIEARWVEIKPNPFHKKSQLYQLSEEGKKAYTNMQNSEIKQMRRLNLDISEKKLEEMLETMNELNEKIDIFLRSED